MASENVVGSTELSKSVKHKKDRKTKSLKGKTRKNKSIYVKPLGLECGGKEHEERLEKLVLGETSALVKEELAGPTSTSETLVPKPKSKKKRLEPAWTDQDPSEYTATRVKKFETYNGNPDWANLDRKRRASLSDDEDSEVLQHAGNLLSRSTLKHANLPKGTLEYKLNLDLNSNSKSNGWIKAIEFHPAATVGLVADDKGDAALFEVNGITNPKLQSIKFEKFPIGCAKFATSGTEFLVGSRYHQHMYCYDMEAATTTRIAGRTDITNFQNFRVSPDGKLIAVAGRFGYVHLLTSRTKELVDTLKMNGELKSISFNSDGTRLYTHGVEGEIYVWDMTSRACIERFHDTGCLSGVALATSPSFIASGCKSGVVNLYSASARKRSPLKSFMNLLTPVTGLAFNGSEEIMAMWSQETVNAVRLVHVPSSTVFTNFPGRQGGPASSASLQVTQVAFSPNGGYMAFGGNMPRVSLVRLKHYGNY